MRTEADLHAAFAVLEDHAPTECSGLVDEARVQSRTRRFAPLAAVVAVVAAVAIAVPLLVSGTHPSGPSTQTTPPPPATQPSVSLRFSFTVGHVAGYTIKVRYIQRDFQHASVAIGAGGGNGAGGAIYVFAPGAFDPTQAKRGKPVEVNGHAGYFAKLTSPTLIDTTRGGDPAVLDAVVWQYAPDRWAMVQVDFRDLAARRGKGVDARAEELKLARAVHTGQSRAMVMPFRFGYLPKGVVSEAAETPTDPLGGVIGLSDGAPTRYGPYGWLPRSALVVWVTNTIDPNGVFCADKVLTRFTSRGQHGCIEKQTQQHSRNLQLDLPGGASHVEILVADDHNRFYSDADLIKIATTLTLAPNVSDPSTWFDATTAMPR